MCGIMGFSGSRNYNQQALEEILICNQVRGNMATGTYSYKENIIKKHNVDARVFLKLFPLPEEDTLIMGHTRHATQGSNIPKNAHPFRIGHLIGIHNGVITNDAALAKEYKFKHTVDSEAIFHVINTKGVQGLKEVHGGCAIAWTDDRKPNSIFLYRRDNPIYIGFKVDALYFSSLQYSLDKADCKDIAMLKPDIVFEIRNGHVISQESVDYVRPSYVDYRNWDDKKESDWRNGWDDNWRGRNGGLVYDPKKGTWEYPVRQAAGFVRHDATVRDFTTDYVPETLADRKRKLDEEYKKPLQIESGGRTSTAFSQSNPAPSKKVEAKIDLAPKKGLSYEDMDDILDVLNDTHDHLTGGRIAGGVAWLKKRIENILY